jgi:hypothetical protein
VLVAFGLCSVALADPPACPPEEEAVLAAYSECAAVRREGGDPAAANVLESHAARLRKVCQTETSLMLDADPSRELRECAQALAIAGRLDEARRIESVGHAYHTEQMLRLTMHGGQVLDPARYHGRPADYEQRRSGFNPPEERVTTPEFSLGKPHGGGWNLVSGKGMPIIFSKDPVWMKNRPVPGQTVVIYVALRDPTGVTGIDAAGFPQAFEELTRQSTTGRFRLMSVTASRRGDPGEYCADYGLSVEERDNPAFPGVVLEIRNEGFVCLEPSSRFLFEAVLSERRPQGTASVLDDVVRGEAEAFLRDIEVKARRNPSPDSPP